MDSTRVYQGVTGNLEPEFITALERVAIDGMVPDLTIILDLPAEMGLARARARHDDGDDTPDRYEKEGLGIHQKRRDAFLDLARAEPERCRIVDGSQPAESVAAAVEKLALDVLANHADSDAPEAGAAPQ